MGSMWGPGAGGDRVSVGTSWWQGQEALGTGAMLAEALAAGGDGLWAPPGHMGNPVTGHSPHPCTPAVVRATVPEPCQGGPVAWCQDMALGAQCQWEQECGDPWDSPAPVSSAGAAPARLGVMLGVRHPPECPHCSSAGERDQNGPGGSRQGTEVQHLHQDPEEDEGSSGQRPRRGELGGSGPGWGSVPMPPC